MIAEVMGTVENGAVKLDEALPFPDQTRVKLRVEPAWDPVATQRAWQSLLAMFDERPIVGVGGPYRREDLYERD
jgi:hypothetical protein